MRTIHLYSNQCYDEAEVWCGDEMYYRDGEATSKIDGATCTACLGQLRDAGERAEFRLDALRPKDWNACPHSAHADDCDCGGTGGDR